MSSSSSFYSLNSSSSSVSSLSSRAPLVKPNQQSSVRVKDFGAALGDLQSSYGFGSAAPSVPLAKRSLSSRAQNNNSTGAPVAPSSASNGSQKDYAAAFADLQVSFGFGGPAPVVKSKKSDSKSEQRQSKSKSKSRSVSLSPPSSSSSDSGADAEEKNYAAAFADLQSSLGFAGAAPNTVAKREDANKGSRRGSGSLLSKLLRVRAAEAEQEYKVVP